MEHPPIILADDFVRQCIAKGIVPPNCKRIAILAGVGEPARLMYECYGDARILELDIEVKQ